MVKTRRKFSLFTNKALFYLIVPIIIESALSMSLGMIDGLMVTNSVTDKILAADPGAGDHFVTAITNIDQISGLLIQLFSAFGVGGAVITSQYLGAGRTDDANKSAKQLVVIMLLFSLVISVLCLALNKQIITLFFRNLDGYTFGYASTYFYITACSFPFLAIFNACAALLRAQRKSMNTMLSGVISFFLNIGFNALFIYALKLGIAGVALGTLLARVFPAVFTLFLMSRKSNAVRLKIIEKFRFDGAHIKKILKLGVPSGVENTLFQLGKILVLVFIQSSIYQTFIGYNASGEAIYTNYQASANSVAYNINTLSSIVGNGINTSILTVIGQAVGTGKIEQVKYYVKKMLCISYAGNTLCVAVIFALSPLLLNFYEVSGEARDIAWHCLVMCLSVQFVTYPLSFGMPAVLKANSDMRFVMIAAVTSMLLMRVGLCYILTCDWAGVRLGALGLWIGMCADWVLRAALFGGRYLTGRWKKSSGLLNECSDDAAEETAGDEVSAGLCNAEFTECANAEEQTADEGEQSDCE